MNLKNTNAAIFTFLLIFSLSSASILAQTNQFFDETDAFFGKYVSEGKVDYKAVLADKNTLNSVLETAKKYSVTTSEAKKYQAFWINAYNLAVIKGVIDNYPLKSPLDVNGFFDETTYQLAGEAITLNDIENKKLRAKFDDARFHFVLVCGAKGCPPIISKAYRPSNIEALLERQTIKALNDSSFIRVFDNEVQLSEIFKWYKEDFVDENSTEIDFLNQFRTNKVPSSHKITYYNYDWRLNSI